MPKITGQRPPANPNKKPTSADSSKQPHDLFHLNATNHSSLWTLRANQHKSIDHIPNTKERKLQLLKQFKNNPGQLNNIIPILKNFNLNDIINLINAGLEKLNLTPIKEKFIIDIYGNKIFSNKFEAKIHKLTSNNELVKSIHALNLLGFEHDDISNILKQTGVNIDTALILLTDKGLHKIIARPNNPNGMLASTKAKDLITPLIKKSESEQDYHSNNLIQLQEQISNITNLITNEETIVKKFLDSIIQDILNQPSLENNTNNYVAISTQLKEINDKLDITKNFDTVINIPEEMQDKLLIAAKFNEIIDIPESILGNITFTNELDGLHIVKV